MAKARINDDLERTKALLEKFTREIQEHPELRQGFLYQYVLTTAASVLLTALAFHLEEGTRQLVTMAEDAATPSEASTLALDFLAALRDVNDDLTRLLASDGWPMIFAILQLQLGHHPERHRLVRHLLSDNHFAHDERYATLRSFLYAYPPPAPAE